MQDVRIDRLCLDAAGLILQGMEKTLYQVLTPEELYALEVRARRERARFVAALFRSIYERVRSSLTAKVVRHA
jgi:hypothetical protein